MYGRHQFRAGPAAVDREYAEGYARVPETAEEMQEATRMAVESINEEPWDKWW